MGNTAPFEMSQRWRAVDNTVVDLPARDLNLKPLVPETGNINLSQAFGTTGERNPDPVSYLKS